MFAVAIDGPAGAGKSSVAKAAAKELGFVYVDTGAIYRTIALHVLRQGVDPHDAPAVEALLPHIQVELAYTPEGQKMLLNGEDVTGLIRTPEVSMATSACSAIPAVRAYLLQLQRDLAEKNNVLMDGRDIGTCVLPDAPAKIYLTASSAVRAGRRYKELVEKGMECDLAEIERDIIDRDYRDMNRENSPLRQAEDAVLVDSSCMTVEQVIAAILEAAKSRGLEVE